MTRPGWIRLTWGFALTLSIATPVAAQRPELVELRFEGAESFTDDQLASAIESRATDCRNILYQVLLLCWAGVGREEAYLNASALEADAFRLRVYYYERGFRNARIGLDTTRVGDEAVRLTFRIDEGRPVRVSEVSVQGAPEELDLDDLPIGPGDPFDAVAYEATRDTLVNRLRNNGFARGQVLVGYTIAREDPYAAVLQYEVVPGTAARFGVIRIEGTAETSPELVHRMLTFEEGDVYDRSALLRSQRNLYGLQVYRYADIRADLEEDVDSVIPVDIRIAEGNLRRVRIGGGLNNIECANVEGQWTSRNFLGDGRRVTVRGRLGNLLIHQCGVLVNDEYTDYEGLTGLAAVDFTQPWLFGPRNSIGVGLFAETRNVPEVFVRIAQGGYVSVSRSLGGSAALTLAYRPERTRLETDGDLVFCVNFVACTLDQVDDLKSPHWLSPMTLSFTVDRTDALFTPSRGFIVRADLEYAARYTGSDFAYTRLLGESSAYLGEPEGLILAARLRGGVGWPHEGSTGIGLNPQKRFFAGGPNSVRGFDQYRLGPTLLGIDAVPWLVNGDAPETEDRIDGAGCTAQEVNEGTCDVSMLDDGLFQLQPSGGEVLLEGNLELRFPIPVLNGKMRGAAFVDAGQVWAERGDVALGEIIATPGVGLRYYSPIGPIRVDAAFNPRGPQALTVLTTEVEACLSGSPSCERVENRTPKEFLRNTDTVSRLVGPVPYGNRLGDIHSLGDFFRRFKLHFSIGQAF